MGQGGWILVVIDEQMVLELARTTLENYGYRVLTAGNGLAAIACFEARQAEIRVLVTDTDMPFQGGLETIQTIQRMRADIPVSVASGIQSDTHRVTRIDTTHLTTLSKSYGVEHLLEAVARVLSVPQKG